MIPDGNGNYDYYYYASDGYDEDTDETYAGWCDKFGYIKKNVVNLLVGTVRNLLSVLLSGAFLDNGANVILYYFLGHIGHK